MSRSDHDSDADAKHHVLMRDFEGARDRLYDSFGQCGGAFRCALICEDRELVAAATCDVVVLLDTSRDTSADLDEHSVTGTMAQRWSLIGLKPLRSRKRSA
jgi:hypothetical protein